MTNKGACQHKNGMKAAHRLHIKMTIYKDGLFGRIGSNPAQDRGGQLQLLALDCLFAQFDEFSLDTVRFELIVQERCHLEDISSM
jgi:hypothetical protein